jgi:hypothetical protein
MPNPKCWVRCIRCGEREQMPRTALFRRSTPRCRACGGVLELSNDARSDLAHSETRRDIPLEVASKLPGNKPRRPCGVRLS